jgi:hypothetical protein
LDDETLVDDRGGHVLSAVCEDGKVRPVRFDRSQVEELRRRARGDQPGTFRLRAATSRREMVTRGNILPVLNVRVRQRGTSRQARPARRGRSAARARAPARSADDPPPDAELVRRPSEQERAA